MLKLNYIHIYVKLYTSLGCPPGFIAIVLTNSGDTGFNGEHTPRAALSFWLLRYWLSLVVRRRIVGMVSSGVTVREWDPKEHGRVF